MGGLPASKSPLLRATFRLLLPRRLLRGRLHLHHRGECHGVLRSRMSELRKVRSSVFQNRRPAGPNEDCGNVAGGLTNTVPNGQVGFESESKAFSGQGWPRSMESHEDLWLPTWTRFELLRANWHCDRTRQRLMFSRWSVWTEHTCPHQAPSLDTSRTCLKSGFLVPRSRWDGYTR